MKLTKQNIEVAKALAESVDKIEAVKVVPRDANGLTEADKRELTERFRGMSQAEIDIFMDLVPVDMCLARIQKELDRAKEFEQTIKTAMAGFK